ncbi:hypothetical protein [Actinomadura meridiana]
MSEVEVVGEALKHAAKMLNRKLSSLGESRTLGGLKARTVLNSLIGIAATTAGGVIALFNPPAGGAVAADGGVVNVLGQIGDRRNNKA